jgi:hypothetical protein
LLIFFLYFVFVYKITRWLIFTPIFLLQVPPNIRFTGPYFRHAENTSITDYLPRYHITFHMATDTPEQLRLLIDDLDAVLCDAVIKGSLEDMFRREKRRIVSSKTLLCYRYSNYNF